MLTGFERCNLDAVLTDTPPNMYLGGRAMDWNRGRWERTRIRFKLTELHPHSKPDEGGLAVLPFVAEEMYYPISYKIWLQH